MRRGALNLSALSAALVAGCSSLPDLTAPANLDLPVGRILKAIACDLKEAAATSTYFSVEALNAFRDWSVDIKFTVADEEQSTAGPLAVSWTIPLTGATVRIAPAASQDETESQTQLLSFKVKVGELSTLDCEQDLPEVGDLRLGNALLSLWDAGYYLQRPGQEQPLGSIGQLVYTQKFIVKSGAGAPTLLTLTIPDQSVTLGAAGTRTATYTIELTFAKPSGAAQGTADNPTIVRFAR